MLIYLENGSPPHWVDGLMQMLLLHIVEAWDRNHIVKVVTPDGPGVHPSMN